MAWLIFFTLIVILKSKLISGLNKLSTIPWRLMREWRYGSIILNLDTRWKCVIIFMPLPLHPTGNIPQSTGGGFGPRACPDVMENRKISWLCRKSNPKSFVVQLVA
jgi:hypothetical protein